MLDKQCAKRTIFFSIIVPVYKTEVYLSKCINSILFQTYRHFELILVDDGSPDQSPQICDRYAQKDSRVQVIHKRNGGLSSARNAGIRIASGDYTIFVDSDDYWDDPAALASVKDALIRYRCEILCTNFCKVQNGADKKERYFEASEPCVGKEAVLLHDRYISSAWSKVVRTTLLQSGNMRFTEHVTAEDIDWSMRLLLRTDRIAYVDLDFYCYLQRSESISHCMDSKKLNDLKTNVYACIAMLREQNETEQKILKKYVSYQYAILLLNTAAMADARERKAAFSQLKQEQTLLSGSASRKVQLMYAASKLFGFCGMMRLLSLFARYRK